LDASARRRRNLALTGISLALHAAFIAWLTLDQGAVFKAGAPDADEILIQLIPPPPPKQAEVVQAPPRAASAGQPIIHPRAAVLPVPTPVAPSPIPATPKPPAPAPPGPPGPGPAGPPKPVAAPPGPQGNVRAALRASVFGCTNGEAVGLNHEERDRCDEHMGAIALGAMAQRAPIDPGKRKVWDLDAAKAEYQRRKRDGAMPLGVDHRDNGPKPDEPSPF
jgi:hypothetical protein